MSNTSYEELTDEEFTALVSSHVRDELEHNWLHEPVNIERYRLKLLELKRSCELQLAGDKSTRSTRRLKVDWDNNNSVRMLEEFEAERDRWRYGNIRFKNGIENKLDQLKSFVRQANNDTWRG